MGKLRSLFVGLGALIAAVASAQFDGPAPLAWRWLPPRGVAASGSPLVVGDTIYVSDGGRVYAVDLTTGNKKWQFPAEDPIPGTFHSSPTLTQGVLVAVGDNKIIYGIDPTTGQSKWSFIMPGAPIGHPIVVDKYLVQAQSDSTLIAIDPVSGSSAWNVPGSTDIAPYHIFDGLTGQIGAVDGNILYFTHKNELHSLDAITEKEQWERPLRFTQIAPNAAPTVFNNTIYVASGSFLVAVNPANGHPVWQIGTGMQFSFQPVVSVQGVFVVSDDGMAMLYGLTDGLATKGMPKPVDLGSFPATQPSAVGTKFIVPTTSGALDLVDPTDGAILWSYVVRPIGKQYTRPSNQAGAGGLGGGPGGPGGLGGGGLGGGGGQGPGGPGGPGGAGNGQNRPEEITEVIASGPAVLAGQTLLVPAKDSSLLAFDKDLGVDLTPPDVKMLFPMPGDQVSGLPPLLLYFRIRDEGTGVDEKTLKISIDGRPYDFTYKRDGTAYVLFSSTSKKNRLLPDGRHEISVDVADWAGNESVTKYAITVDNTLPPIKLPGQTTRPNGGRGGPGGLGGPGGGGNGGGGGGGNGGGGD